MRLVVEAALQGDFSEHHRRRFQQFFAFPEPVLAQPLLGRALCGFLEDSREMAARQPAGFGKCSDQYTGIQVIQHHLLAFDLRLIISTRQ